MTRWKLLLAGLLCCGSANADRLYSDGFETPLIAPLFPLLDGHFQLPDEPAANQLAWILAELAVGETTTVEEIQAHFDPSWSISVPATQGFFATLRSTYPDAVVTDVVGVSPVQLTVVIDAPGSGAPYGFLNLQTRYTGTRGIVQFGVSGYAGSVQYPEDRTLDLGQAAAKFHGLSAAPALLVGRIGVDGHCRAIVDDAASSLRATASIFKIWVLGGVGRAVADGLVGTGEGVPMVASELAPGGTINTEPAGTVFTVAELATLMMAISDNTATDLLHELVGREWIGAVIDDFGVAAPDVLKPLLGISEQFHLFRSFPLDTSLAYINGSEAFQQQFLDEQIVPLGPQSGGAYFHTQLLTSGTWRATPLDVCAAFAHLRRLPQGSDAIAMVDRALGSQAAQPDVRAAWDRVWYKGGSLATDAGYHVLTHAWMLENAGEDPYVVVAMSNSDGGGIDPYKVQSVTGRILQLLSQLP